MEASTSISERVGHGPIRLRHEDGDTSIADHGSAVHPPAGGDPAGGEQTTAPAGEPVGHGTIRLRDGAAVASEVVAGDAPPIEAAAHVDEAPAVAAEPPAEIAPQPEPEPEFVGHGSIRLLDRTLRLPIEATLAAEADILELLTAGV
ncbi:MAG TPA: hypothetical protein VHZ31_06580 [Solirubrobacteraceae bacterium]|jgi:hypothetical protein|nr:hypothetical protein [Solirubrobacteraceae bacterium]